VGVRAMGLSGAFSAIADDASAAYWNPAGLAQLKNPEVLAMYGSYFNDKDRNIYFSVHYPFQNDIHLSISANNLFYTDIKGAHEDQYTASVAVPLDFVTEKRFLIGGNFRFLYANMGEGNGTSQGFGADLGVLFRQIFPKGNEFRAALVLNDISTEVTFNDTGYKQKVPPILTLGIAYKIDPDTLLAADLPWTLSDDILLNEQNIRIRTGAEHWFFDGRFGLRAGFISFVTLPGEFSLGASYRATDWNVNYGFMNHAENLGNSHRFSVSYLFDSSGAPEPKPYILQSYVGDQKIYLSWEIPEGSKTDGYLVYVRKDDEKDFYRAKQEILQTKYCLLRGAQNGMKYHVFIRTVMNAKEKYSCNEWVATPKPMSEDAKKYYDAGLKDFQINQFQTALSSARKAEELDPDNYEIKDLIRKLETTNHEGLVPEKGGE
jgi:hypothetical protein